MGFLADHGPVEADTRRSAPVVYRVHDGIDRHCDGLEGLPENFARVVEGETFARGDCGVVRADETFHPVLDSDGGYDDVYGFRAVREGRLSERSTARPVCGAD